MQTDVLQQKKMSSSKTNYQKRDEFRNIPLLQNRITQT